MNTRTDSTATSPDYRAIYDDIITRQDNYNRAENSPGYQACLIASDRLRVLDGPVLDVGCGVGFAAALLQGSMFGFDVWAADVSEVAVERARERLGTDRVTLLESNTLPYPDATFGLVTCFDVVEHLDEADIAIMFGELERVTRPGGVIYCTASCRAAGSVDCFGDNLHRTIKPAQWWIDVFAPDEAVVHPAMQQVSLWKKKKKKTTPQG